jgi:hypothetical protein
MYSLLNADMVLAVRSKKSATTSTEQRSGPAFGLIQVEQTAIKGAQTHYVRANTSRLESIVGKLKILDASIETPFGALDSAVEL